MAWRRMRRPRAPASFGWKRRCISWIASRSLSAGAKSRASRVRVTREAARSGNQSGISRAERRSRSSVASFKASTASPASGRTYRGRKSTEGGVPPTGRMVPNRVEEHPFTMLSSAWKSRGLSWRKLLAFLVGEDRVVLPDPLDGLEPALHALHAALRRGGRKAAAGNRIEAFLQRRDPPPSRRVPPWVRGLTGMWCSVILRYIT